MAVFITTVNQIFNNRSKNKINKNQGKFVFSPEDIRLKDDAFHDVGLGPFTEWWYFDANFENGYSCQLGLRLISLLKKVLVFSRLDIYKDGKLLAHKRKIHLNKDFETSSEIPFVKLNGKEALNGFIDKNNGRWVYDLSFDMGEISANLRFIGSTNGWKGDVPGNCWVVVLPRANVTGKLKIKNKEIEVAGSGYHDHNWNVKPDTVFNFGWFWGKINSKNYTLIWANVLKSKAVSCPLLVINENNRDYFNIKPDCIKILTKDIRKENGIKIPHSFTITADYKNISLHVDMKVLKIHYVRIMGFMKYWRYHVKCTGAISVNSQKEEINELQIAEFLRFK